MSHDAKSNTQRIIAVLKGFDAQNTARRSADILADLGSTRSTGFGLLRALVRADWLERVDHGLLRLGPKAYTLAFAPMEAPEAASTRKLMATPGQRQTGIESGTPDLEWDPSLVRMVDTLQFARRPPYRIGFANASTGNAWRRAMQGSMNYARRMAQTRISDFLVLDAQDDPALQRAQIDHLVRQDIDLLLVSTASVSDTQLSDQLKEVSAGGLPVVAVDRRPNERASLTSFVTASDHRIGRISALWLVEHLQGQGHLWMLSGLEGTSPALRRQQAALSVFAQFPGIHVDHASHTDWTPASGYRIVGQMLDEGGHPPDGVWCDSGLQGVGSVRQFLDRGLEIPAHTGGDLNEMYTLCLTHRVPMAALDYPASMGARALEVALEILGGEPVPQRVEVPVQIVLPRGFETRSIKADTWSERHVAWDLDGEAILSQGPALRRPNDAGKRGAVA